MANGQFTFVGGSTGAWCVRTVKAISGQPLEPVTQLDILSGNLDRPSPGTLWKLRGVISNARYVTREERDRLESRQPNLGRPEASCAALIPIRKSAAWWNLAQDERREILEAQSQHITAGLRYLPAIARRLYHSRDLGEPFDFLTWFEFAPSDSAAFDELVAELRASKEWNYVEREVDLRLVRSAS